MDAFSQLLNWHVATAMLSGVFSMAAAVPYILDVVRRGGHTRPNAVSFGLWTVLQAIALAAQIKSGASWSVVIVFFVTLNTLVITALALSGFGYKSYGKIDALSFVLAVLAIAIMRYGDPVLAIWLAITADFFASVPTVVKTAREPYSEELTAWGMITVAAVLGTVSTERFDAANLAMPIYLMAMNGTIFLLIYFGRKTHSKPIAG